MSHNEAFIYAAGTKVVVLEDIQRNQTVILNEGMVGVIKQAPLDNTHNYVVRFPNGDEHSLKRRQFAVQKHYRREGFGAISDEHSYYDYVIYRVIIGSRAFGLDTEDSDIDRRGIYLPPADLHWSLYGVPEQLERGEDAYWELQKFIKLALKANPNILETLYSPKVEYVAPIAQELLEQRHIFMSKLLYQTYNGYVLSQFKKLHKHLDNHGTIRWKHAMHLIRLLLSGITALETGTIMVDVGKYRDQLLAIRHEEMAWEHINDWRLQLHKRFDESYQVTSLPERPDYAAANDYLIQARKRMVNNASE